MGALVVSLSLVDLVAFVVFVELGAVAPCLALVALMALVKF